MGMAATKRLYTREEVARLATAEANPLGGLSIIHAQLFLNEIQVSNAQSFWGSKRLVSAAAALAFVCSFICMHLKN